MMESGLASSSTSSLSTQVDPIRPHRLVSIQVAQQVVNCFLLDYGGFILLSIPVFQHWALTTLGTTSLTIKD